MISEDNRALARLQRKQLEILRELDRVCRLCNIRYYLSSGTCLGAVRHGGFIPWDDDVDVYMYWKDAQRLAEHQNLFKPQFFVQSKTTDPNVRTSHYRLRDSSTSMFLKEDCGDDINHGIFIDIYILYPYPDNRLLAAKLRFDSFISRILMAGRGPQNHGRAAKAAGELICWLYRGEKAKRKVKAIEREYRKNGGKHYLATYFGRDITLFHCVIYPRTWFSKPVKLPFEDMEVCCPGDPDAYCRLQYGDTYMELPPKEKRIPHHEFMYCSVSEPYTNYTGKYNGRMGRVTHSSRTAAVKRRQKGGRKR